MAGFALIFVVPLMLYCVVQTLRDLNRRSWMLAAYGVLMVVLMISIAGRILGDTRI